MTKLHTATGELIYIETLALNETGHLRFNLIHIHVTGFSEIYRDIDHDEVKRLINQLGAR